jgi:divalent metal cation (Fe/Co/Zn/Cd) transporter
LFVVAVIFISACVAGVEPVRRLIEPVPPDHLWALAAAGVIGLHRQPHHCEGSVCAPAIAWTVAR